MEESLKHRLIRMVFVALVGAAVLGLGNTAQRLHAGGAGCGDYSCTGDTGCAKKGCGVCAGEHPRCLAKPY